MNESTYLKELKKEMVDEFSYRNGGYRIHCSVLYRLGFSFFISDFKCKEGPVPAKKINKQIKNISFKVML